MVVWGNILWKIWVWFREILDGFGKQFREKMGQGNLGNGCLEEIVQGNLGGVHKGSLEKQGKINQGNFECFGNDNLGKQFREERGQLNLSRGSFF